MTDTAQPYPDEQTDEESLALTSDQQRRAAALTESRFILATNGGIFGGQKLGEHWTVQDLLTVADYILGVGPFNPPEKIELGGAAQSDDQQAASEGYWWKPLTAPLDGEPAPADDLTPSDPSYAEEGEPTEVLPSIPSDDGDYERGTPQ